MNRSSLLVPALALVAVSGVGVAQQVREAAAPPSGQSAVLFVDAAGDVTYRVPRSLAHDADALQRALWIAQLYERFAAHASGDATAAEAKMYMTSRWPGLGDAGEGAAAAVAASAEPATSPRATEGVYTIRCDFSAALVRGTFVMFQPVKASAGATMMGAATMGGATMGAATMGGTTAKPSDAVPGEIARAALVDGRCTVEGAVDHVHPVYFYVLDAETADGRRMAPTKGQGFLLEPARLNLTMNQSHRHIVTGGYFNDAVYGVWQHGQAYQDLQALLPLAFRSVAGESEAEGAAWRELGMAVQNSLLDTETAGRKQIALHHPDNLVRQLVIETAWLGGPWMLEGAREVLALEPDNAWAQQYVARAEAREKQSGRGAQAGSVGSRYLPFRAEALDGSSVSLAETCAENRYVLLEFWASWCGPCRGEIPHLKAAYAQYHDAGFEIFGVTIDDKRGAWEKASAQEELPWIDTGFGTKSDAAQLYAISGVPANYLIDGATGMVVARNLRGEALAEKLKALLGER